MMNGGARIPRRSRNRLPAPPARRGDGLRSSPGVRYVSERMRGRWLVSLIVSHQQNQHFAQVGRQSWRLERGDIVGALSDARVTCADADGRILLSLTIRTDFPSPGVELLIRDGCLFLPSEDWAVPHSLVRRLAAVPRRLASIVLRSLAALPDQTPASRLGRQPQDTSIPPLTAAVPTGPAFRLLRTPSVKMERRSKATRGGPTIGGTGA